MPVENVEKCLCGSNILLKDCCEKKYPSLKISTSVDLTKASKYEAWGSSRKGLWFALAKQLALNPGLNKNIIILGAGACTDVPIDFICDKFSQVVLVDNKRESLEQSKQYIPLHLLEKVKFVTWDIAQIAKYNNQIAKGELGDINAVCNYLNNLAANMPEVKIPEEIQSLMPFDFCISDLVITQLASDTLVSLSQLTGDVGNLTKTKDIAPFCHAVTLNHMKLLHRLTRTEGRILAVTDTFMMGTEIDGTQSPVNNELKIRGKSILNASLITNDILLEWIQKYSCINGSDFWPILKNNGFMKLKSDTRYQWWWTFSDEKWYLVLCWVIIPLDRDYDLTELITPNSPPMGWRLG